MAGKPMFVLDGPKGNRGGHAMSHNTMWNDRYADRADRRLLGGPERPFSWEKRDGVDARR